MNTHLEKAQINTMSAGRQESPSAANTVAQKRASSKPTFQLIDNRPEALQARELQALLINSSPKVQQLKAIQTMAENNPHARQAAQLQTMTNDYALGKEADLMGNIALQMKQPNNNHRGKLIHADFARQHGCIQRRVVVVGTWFERKITLDDAANKLKKGLPYLMEGGYSNTMEAGHKKEKELGIGIRGIGTEEPLVLVGHGSRSLEENRKFGGLTSHEIAILLITELPHNYNGEIYLASCFSGTRTNHSTARTSMIELVGKELRINRRDIKCNIVGNIGTAVPGKTKDKVIFDRAERKVIKSNNQHLWGLIRRKTKFNSSLGQASYSLRDDIYSCPAYGV